MFPCVTARYADERCGAVAILSALGCLHSALGPPSSWRSAVAAGGAAGGASPGGQDDGLSEHVLSVASDAAQSVLEVVEAMLAEVGARAGCRAHLIDDASALDFAWLDGAQTVGVTAGASAPERRVEQVVERLAKLAPGVDLAQQPEVDEGIVFQLPALLR